MAGDVLSPHAIVLSHWAASPRLWLCVPTMPPAIISWPACTYWAEFSGIPAGWAIDDWKMAAKYRDRYDRDPNVKHIRIQFQVGNWWE